MGIQAAKIVKTIARASFYLLTGIIGFTLFALVLNAVLLHFLVPEMAKIIATMPQGHMAEAGGSGPVAILFLAVLIVVYWPITLIIICFGIVFPVLYFINGKRHGIRKALNYIVSDNRDFIMEYTIDRLLDHVKKTTGAAGAVDAVVSKAAILNMLPAYLKKLDTMPRPMRMIFRMLINKIDLGGILTRIIEEQKGGDDTAIRFDTLTRIAKEKTAEALGEKLFAPDLKWFFILFGANMAIFAVLKIAI